MPEAVPHRALQLPDILTEIFSLEKDHAANLYRYALVCKLWSTLACKALWSYYTPDIKHLQILHEAGALAKYIPLIRHLSLRCEACGDRPSVRPADHPKWHEFLKSFGKLYPQLDFVSLNIGAKPIMRNMEFLENILRPGLREVTISGVCPLRYTFPVLQENTPYLEVVRIACDYTSRQEASIPKFVSNMPKLREITGISLVTVNDFLEYSKHRALERLEMLSNRPVGLLDEYLPVKHQFQSSFPMLRRLDLGGPSHGNEEWKDSVVNLLSVGSFRELRYLSVRSSTRSAGGDLIPLLANCPHLESVFISLAPVGPPDWPLLHGLTVNNVLTCLHACRQLHKFEIRIDEDRNRTPHPDPKDISPVSSEDLCKVFAALPLIRYLAIDWPVSLGIREIRALHDLCPRIVSFELGEGRSTLDYESLTHDLQLPVLPKVTNFLQCIRERHRTDENPSMPTETPRQHTDDKRKQELLVRMLPAMYEHIFELSAEV